MKSFKSIVAEQSDSSLDMVTHYVKTRNVGAISAERTNLSPEENTNRTKSLRKDLQASGIQHIPVKGRYIHDFGTPKAHPTDENSFFVHSDNDILPHLKRLGEKYGQDSILHKGKDESTAKLYGTNHTSDYPGYGKTADVGSYKPNHKAEFHSVLKNGSVFSFSG